MVSKEILVGIGIAVGLAVGLGAGFGFSGASLEPENDSQVLDMQSVRKMMLDDPSAMQEMILTTMQDSDQMQMMEEMMKQMMEEMKSDPELKKAMMEHMDRMKASKEAMMGIQDDQMMTGSSMGSGMTFNPDVQITIPMIDGYYNGNKVYFVHTEISDQKMADMMTMMVNFPTLYVSDLENIPKEDLGKFYVFTNGISGTGPYGGGPFFFQIDIFDSVPGMDEHTQFKVPQLVTWNEDSNPRLLTSTEKLFDAQANGELSIESADFVVNAPMVVWTLDDGKEQTASLIQNMFQSMQGADGEVVNVDVDNYIATFKLKSDKQMNMMN